MASKTASRCANAVESAYSVITPHPAAAPSPGRGERAVREDHAPPAWYPPPLRPVRLHVAEVLRLPAGGAYGRGRRPRRPPRARATRPGRARREAAGGEERTARAGRGCRIADPFERRSHLASTGSPRTWRPRWREGNVGGHARAGQSASVSPVAAAGEGAGCAVSGRPAPRRARPPSRIAAGPARRGRPVERPRRVPSRKAPRCARASLVGAQGARPAARTSSMHRGVARRPRGGLSAGRVTRLNSPVSTRAGTLRSRRERGVLARAGGLPRIADGGLQALQTWLAPGCAARAASSVCSGVRGRPSAHHTREVLRRGVRAEGVHRRAHAVEGDGARRRAGFEGERHQGDVRRVEERRPDAPREVGPVHEVEPYLPGGVRVDGHTARGRRPARRRRPNAGTGARGSGPRTPLGRQRPAGPRRRGARNRCTARWWGNVESRTSPRTLPGGLAHEA